MWERYKGFHSEDERQNGNKMKVSAWLHAHTNTIQFVIHALNVIELI